MAGTLKTHIVKPLPDTWTQIMGQGVRALTEHDEFTTSLQIQNQGADKATLLVAVLQDATAPASDDAVGVFNEIVLKPGAIQPIDRIACEAGVTVWVKADHPLSVWAFAHFHTTQ